MNEVFLVVASCARGGTGAFLRAGERVSISCIGEPTGDVRQTEAEGSSAWDLSLPVLGGKEKKKEGSCSYSFTGR